MPRLDDNQVVKASVGSPNYMGTITASGVTAVNNAGTSVPFALTAGRMYRVQPDSECYILTANSAGGAVTAANGFYLASRQMQDFLLDQDESWISVLKVSATVNVKVWEMR